MLASDAEIRMIQKLADNFSRVSLCLHQAANFAVEGNLERYRKNLGDGLTLAFAESSSPLFHAVNNVIYGPMIE